MRSLQMTRKVVRTVAVQVTIGGSAYRLHVQPGSTCKLCVGWRVLQHLFIGAVTSVSCQPHLPAVAFNGGMIAYMHAGMFCDDGGTVTRLVLRGFKCSQAVVATIARPAAGTA